MKLPDVVHGPMTLSEIDYSPRLSQETAAFTGKLCYAGSGCAGVSNDGHGGANMIEMWGDGRRIQAALERYAEDHPPYHHREGTLAMSADLLVSLLVDEALAAYEARRAAAARAGEPAPALTGMQLVTRVRDALAAAGMPRTSTMAGGALTGWTDTLGSTGFSVRMPSRQDDRGTPGTVVLHMVVSGKAAGLRYRQWTDRQDEDNEMEMHEPIDAERLFGRIKAALQGIGLDVVSLHYTGAQMHWDDDVDYEAVVVAPEGLEPPPRRRR